MALSPVMVLASVVVLTRVMVLARGRVAQTVVSWLAANEDQKNL